PRCACWRSCWRRGAWSPRSSARSSRRWRARRGGSVRRWTGCSASAEWRRAGTASSGARRAAPGWAPRRFSTSRSAIPRVAGWDGGGREGGGGGEIRVGMDNVRANAKKYAPEGTPYRVSVRRDAGGVAITVADRGPGIAQRDRERIFEPFERADDRLSRATEGSGIGLSLVRHVARAHGGRAFVESEPGRGARFTIWIPCSTEAEP